MFPSFFRRPAVTTPYLSKPSIAAALSLLIGLPGCASQTPLATVPRASGVATVRIEGRVSLPESFTYQSRGAAGIRAMESAGIVGVLPAEIMAAASNSGGRRRFEPVFRRAVATLPGIVRTAFQDELVLARYFRVFTPETRATDGAFRLTVLSVGLDAATSPDGTKRSRPSAGLAPTLQVRAELVKADGTVVWRRDARGVGGRQSLASYEAAPELFARGIEDAVDEVARKLVRDEPARDNH